MNALERTRLEKAAADCGFEHTPQLTGDALVLRSSRFPESGTVQPLGQDVFVLTASGAGVLPHVDMLSANAHHVSEAAPNIQPLTFTVQGWQALYRALDKAAANARTLPNRVAQKFHQATAKLPTSTEAERWVVQRVGQDLFRGALLDYWRAGAA